VRIEPRTDVADRFRTGSRLRCDGIGELTVASARGAPSAPIVRFDGYADRPSALALRGRFLRVTREQSRRDAGASHLWADLVGLRVENEAHEVLGEITDVLRAGETDVLVVRRPGGGELLLPTIESVIRKVDLGARCIVVAPQQELD
jgi:16S rRNA processing protein RimM